MTPSTATELPSAIITAKEVSMAAVKRGDAAGLAALYTENAQVLPPNSDLVMGKRSRRSGKPSWTWASERQG